ncbi:MAG: hypothetical protein SWK90_06320 [Chloroflexota bacterium]|nr:hypothetical protein [Chloroflexota bacterium]
MHIAFLNAPGNFNPQGGPFFTFIAHSLSALTAPHAFGRIEG